jgi:sortase A
VKPPQGALAPDRLLLVLGATLLGLWTAHTLHAGRFQEEQGAAFDRARAEARPAGGGAEPGEVLGRVVVERLGISSLILEGADAENLDRAVGHVAGTALPGAAGNVALAAHRDAHFAPLRDVRAGDRIRIETLAGDFHYVVDTTFVTSPEDVSVLEATREPTLTLVTCHPFGWIGPAPSRFIVRARGCLTSAGRASRCPAVRRPARPGSRRPPGADGRSRPGRPSARAPRPAGGALAGQPRPDRHVGMSGLVSGDPVQHRVPEVRRRLRDGVPDLAETPLHPAGDRACRERWPGGSPSSPGRSVRGTSPPFAERRQVGGRSSRGARRRAAP